MICSRFFLTAGRMSGSLGAANRGARAATSLIAPRQLLEHAMRLWPSDGIAWPEEDRRRSVSAAYYALFHTLVEDASARIAASAVPALQHRVARAYDHAVMRRVCNLFRRSEFAKSPILETLIALPVEPDLILVAEAFTLLQDGRHTADYDLMVEFLPIEAGNLLTYAIEACDAWALVRETSNAAVFPDRLSPPRTLEPPWLNPPTATSARTAAPSTPNGPAAATPAASGTRSSRKRLRPALARPPRRGPASASRSWACKARRRLRRARRRGSRNWTGCSAAASCRRPPCLSAAIRGSARAP